MTTTKKIIGSSILTWSTKRLIAIMVSYSTIAFGKFSQQQKSSFLLFMLFSLAVLQQDCLLCSFLTKTVDNMSSILGCLFTCLLASELALPLLVSSSSCIVMILTFLVAYFVITTCSCLSSLVAPLTLLTTSQLRPTPSPITMPIPLIDTMADRPSWDW
mmetsp:Transcript_2102/g.3841  ORF Transcript_2102/g.3841 Transcript_2102/m.3841 type:complete len:159 (+) Transcript_2102:4145-4621(+)